MSGTDDILGPIDNVSTTPTIPLTDITRQRFSELANQFNTALQQGYVEANVLTKLLDLVQQIIPLLTKV